MGKFTKCSMADKFKKIKLKLMNTRRNYTLRSWRNLMVVIFVSFFPFCAKIR